MEDNDINANFVRNFDETFIEGANDISVNSSEGGMDYREISTDQYSDMGSDATGNTNPTIAPTATPEPFIYANGFSDGGNGYDYYSVSVTLKKELTNFFGLNYKIIKDLIIGYEERNATNLKIEDSENICTIELDEIPEGAFYYKCTECAKIIEKNNLKTWLMKQGYDKASCPHCRECIQTYPELFINR